MKRSALIDSSSAILLYKAGLFIDLFQIYSIIMSRSVFRELTHRGRAGSKAFKEYKKYGRFMIKKRSPAMNIDTELKGLDAGERDTIILFLEGFGEFIIIDDGQGVSYCINNSIPHINALLIPKIFLFKNILTGEECENKIEKIISVGRYSGPVISYAEGCGREELRKFLL